MTAASPTSPAKQSTPKSAIRACQFCRVRKIKCDTLKPKCGSCMVNKRECVYVNEPPKKRPSKAIINGLSKEKRALEDFIALLKGSSSTERNTLLSSVIVKDGKVNLPQPPDVAAPSNHGSTDTVLEEMISNGSLGADSMEVDDIHQVDSSSADDDTDSLAQFHPPSILEQSHTIHSAPDHCHSHLIAAAALQLQREHAIRHLDYIRG